jgi:nickel-dependent lactate racemase
LKNKFTKELIKKIINPNDPDIKDGVWTGLMDFIINVVISTSKSVIYGSFLLLFSATI